MTKGMWTLSILIDTLISRGNEFHIHPLFGAFLGPKTYFDLYVFGRLDNHTFLGHLIATNAWEVP